MEIIISYYYAIGFIGRLFFIAYLVFFAWVVIKLPIKSWEKLGWILLFAILPGIGAFIFYAFRNSKFLLHHSSRKFNPDFNRSKN